MERCCKTCKLNNQWGAISASWQYWTRVKSCFFDSRRANFFQNKTRHLSSGTSTATQRMIMFKLQSMLQPANPQTSKVPPTLLTDSNVLQLQHFVLHSCCYNQRQKFLVFWRKFYASEQKFGLKENQQLTSAQFRFLRARAFDKELEKAFKEVLKTGSRFGQRSRPNQKGPQFESRRDRQVDFVTLQRKTLSAQPSQVGLVKLTGFVNYAHVKGVI